MPAGTLAVIDGVDCHFLIIGALRGVFIANRLTNRLVKSGRRCAVGIQQMIQISIEICGGTGSFNADTVGAEMIDALVGVGQHTAVGIKVIGLFTNGLPAGLIAAVLEVIGDAVDLFDAVGTAAVGFKIIFFAVGFLPTGAHHTITVKKVTLGIIGLQTRLGTPCLKQIFLAVHRQKTRGGFGIAFEIIPLAVDLLPARNRLSVGSEIILLFTKGLPAVLLFACFKAIFGVAHGGQAVGKQSLRGEIQLVPVRRLPARCGFAVGEKIIFLLFVSLPTALCDSMHEIVMDAVDGGQALCHTCILTEIIGFAVNFLPAHSSIALRKEIIILLLHGLPAHSHNVILTEQIFFVSNGLHPALQNAAFIGVIGFLMIADPTRLHGMGIVQPIGDSRHRDLALLQNTVGIGVIALACIGDPACLQDTVLGKIIILTADGIKSDRLVPPADKIAGSLLVGLPTVISPLCFPGKKRRDPSQ